MDQRDRSFLETYAPIITHSTAFHEEAYQRFNVKRGLRNSDGSGVLVGLTEIGDVHGYIVDENETKPVHGRLRYRGISVTEIVQGFQSDRRFGFEETAFLLLFGKLPKTSELEEFAAMLGRHRALPNNFTEDMILKAPSPDVMNKLARCVLAYYSYDADAEERSLTNQYRQCIGLIAMFPTMAAYAYQAKRRNYDGDSLYIHTPSPDHSTAESFLQMIRPDKAFDRLEAELLDLCFVLHAEHGGGNNSAFTIRVVSSSDTDTYSAVAAAIGSLKGSLHGGANIQVMGMMQDIEEHVSRWDDQDEVDSYLMKILKRDACDRSGLIYGIGHAVYTLSDPRAILLKEKALDLAKAKGREDEFRLYDLVERRAPEIFKQVKGPKKVMAANVDFYSGFVYSMLDIPHELFTPIFAVSRIAGWAAHRMEEVVHGSRIVRPAFKSVSQAQTYRALSER